MGFLVRLSFAFLLLLFFFWKPFFRFLEASTKDAPNAVLLDAAKYSQAGGERET